MPRAMSSADTGRRTHFLKIEQLVEGQAESNFPTENWITLQNAWAAREYITLDEEFKVDQHSATSVTAWDIPYSTFMDPDRIDVAKKRRIVYLGRTFDILRARLSDDTAGRSIILETLAKVG